MMATSATHNLSRLTTNYLPAYAGFLLDHCLDDYARKQAELFRIFDVTLPNNFSPQDKSELQGLLRLQAVEMLTQLNEKNTDNQIQELITRWATDQPGVKDLFPAIAENITLLCFIRKQALLSFVENYTQEPKKIVALVREIDQYILKLESASLQIFIDLLGQRVNEQAIFNEKLTNSSPCISNSIPAQVLASTINIDDEKSNAQKLKQHEEELQSTITKLRQNEDLFKEAQRITHIGNFVWDFKTNKIEWSDELYRIHGLEPQSIEPTYDFVLAFNHPDDADRNRELIQTAIGSGQPLDFHYRIISRDGKTKMLHAKGRVLYDDNHGPLKLIGTAQDVTERHELIQNLLRSQDLYKQAQTLSKLGNWRWEINKNTITWSDELYNIFGITPKSGLSFDEFLSFIHPHDKSRLLAAIKTSVEKQVPYEAYHRIVRRDGTVRHLHSKGNIEKAHAGQPSALYGITQDVTEQQLLIEKLSSHQVFIQKITDAAPSIICSYNVHTGQYLFVNNSVQNLLGYDPQQVLAGGLAFVSSLIHPEDLEKVMVENAIALEKVNREAPQEGKEAVFEFKYRMRHADGRYRWIQTFGTVFERDDNQMVQNILNISFDITEQLEAEALIREQEHFIQHIVEASPNILYVFDLEEERFVYINKEVEKLLGYTAAEIMALDKTATQELYHPDDLLLLPYRGQKEDATVDPIRHFECRMKNKQGHWRWLLTREVVFRRNKHGNPQQFVGAALDITDRKEMEMMLKQKTFQLEQSNASLEEFAYIASHDLKEPLRKISSFGDRLMAKHAGSLDEDGKLFLGKMVESSKRMQTMITDLLAVSRLSGNKSFEVCNLNELLNETLQTLELEIEKKSAVVEVASLPGARVIPSQIRQLFQNLLSNSLKFVRHDVAPVVKITHRPVCANEAVKLNLPGTKNYLRIDVVDNGIGFDNQFAGKIFAIFQRLHGRSEYGGTGIGLTICKKIVENHEGVIIADSKPGQGSVFSVIIPV